MYDRIDVFLAYLFGGMIGLGLGVLIGAIVW